MKTVRVKFPADGRLSNDRTYDYLSDDIVEKDAKVVVNSPSSGYVVVTVVDVFDTEKVKATKWIVCVVDDSKYKQKLADEAERQEILALLEKKSKKIEEVKKYEYLSGIDADAAKLLERLKDLTNGQS